MSYDTAATAEKWDEVRKIKDLILLIEWQKDQDPSLYAAPEVDAAGDEGDDEVRYCTTCERPRWGYLGEFIEAQNGGRTDPSWDAGTSWVCGACDTDFDCGISDDRY